MGAVILSTLIILVAVLLAVLLRWTCRHLLGTPLPAEARAHAAAVIAAAQSGRWIRAGRLRAYICTADTPYDQDLCRQITDLIAATPTQEDPS